MSYTPFNAPLNSGFLGDREIAACFSVKVEIAAMALFEAALARATAAVGLIPHEAGEAIAAICSRFEPDIERISAAAARDGVAVPELVAQIRAAVGEPHSRHVHFGATGQDVVDTALMIRLKPVVAKLKERLRAIDRRIGELDRDFGTNRLAARTRMRRAGPITVSDRLKNWRGAIARHLERLDTVALRLLGLQLGGPVGTRGDYAGKAAEVAAEMAGMLGLSAPPAAWHVTRDTVAEFASLLSLISGSLGKIGQDIALMAQDEFAEIGFSGAGGASSAAQTQYPVKAETLVTLARFNATLVSGMHQSLVHEQERSGAAWTLEWMLLPQICVAAGASTRNALELLGTIERLGRAA